MRLEPSQRITTRRSQGRRGQAMIEFALCFLLFMAVIFGFSQIAMAVWMKTTLHFAVREGIRDHGPHVGNLGSRRLDQASDSQPFGRHPERGTSGRSDLNSVLRSGGRGDGVEYRRQHDRIGDKRLSSADVNGHCAVVGWGADCSFREGGWPAGAVPESARALAEGEEMIR